jgi:hypothetical protein
MLPVGAGRSKQGCELLAIRWIVLGLALNTAVAGVGIVNSLTRSSAQAAPAVCCPVNSLAALYADLAP